MGLCVRECGVERVRVRACGVVGVRACRGVGGCACRVATPQQIVGATQIGSIKLCV